MKLNLLKNPLVKSQACVKFPAGPQNAKSICALKGGYFGLEVADRLNGKEYISFFRGASHMARLTSLH